MNVARIYVFGDSLVAGTYDLQGGWCDRIKRDLHRITVDSTDGKKYQTYNLGIGGETSLGLAGRIKSELAARHKPEWPPVVIIGIGKNDSRLLNGLPEVSIQEYEANLEQILVAAREITEKIIFIGLGPCAEEEISFKNYTYTRERLLSYDTVLTNFAKKHNVIKVDVYHNLLHNDGNVHYRDRLHLNDRGYEMLYEMIRPHLFEMLGLR